MGEDVLLELADLRTTFYTDKETIHAVDGVSFDIDRGETVGIVGESGSGKSVTARSIMGLIKSPGRIHPSSSIRYRDVETVRTYADQFSSYTVDVTDADEVVGREDDIETRREAIQYLANDDDFVFVEEREPSRNGSEAITAGYIDLARASDEALRRIRGGGIAMIFQDPLTSLNPVYTVGNQIKEALELHQGLTGNPATEEAISLLEAVGIPDAPRRLEEYPHQFSGGMRQRAVIAMALACDPELIIADEPTTALDVTIQAQILDLLRDLQAERDLGIMFITHDMGVIAQISDRVNVMYAGEIVESGPVVELFENPRHPYTRGLLDSIPGRQVGAERLSTIEGDVPTPTEEPTDCRFEPRCPKAFDACESVHPMPVDVSESEADHTAACLLYPSDRDRSGALEMHRARTEQRQRARQSLAENGGDGA
ncbi:ABC-type dipeptide/oligopeptide/nickel transportsystem, ATPase component [Halanaeroarchaeum sp. HSR-CO]|uniref:oligopeptide/dipeptide ABC transporter ATP-binding protein n=1 Tax=Halanaeroarchaeum sp. HSR-CO TaxID=2866382 RepID=UPI00217D3965|nr:oligopeptide/dipeptide ABC transporter ATP-binding protein [Halanaeroarchaeum sp. HSR-CO]UWG46396.1 ABC-type dipeptide/oligopeptide/nickel transportsystem, ATPase component [Halanaeroarchaeum sp. HSR-CO]